MAESAEAVEEAAVRWFARRQAGAWTSAEQARFESWLEQSTAHRIHYLRAETSWNHAARMRALGAGIPPGVIPPRQSWGDTRYLHGGAAEAGARRENSGEIAEQQGEALPSRTRGFPGNGFFRERRRFALAAVAASIVGGLLLSTELLNGSRYATPIGGQKSVSLADGSQVTLNTDSRIRVVLSATERRVELQRGEAFFEVVRETGRPFVVEAGNRRIVVLGTKFSARRDADDLQVVVTEGRVRLEGNGAAAPPTQLDAGAVARAASSAVIVEQTPAADVSQLLSWRSGYVNFQNTELAKAVAEFNRYSARKIVIADPSIARIRIGGNFRTSNAEAFLWLLQTGFPVSVEQRDDRIVLSAR